MEQELKELGLTQSEVRLYMTLLKYKEISAQALAQKAEVDRSVTYNLLSSLMQKGLVGSLEKNNKKAFFATDPENLLLDIKIKEDIAKRVIKKINTLRTKQHDDDFVKVFHGPRGSKKFYNLLIQHKKPKTVYTIGGSGKSIERFKLFYPYFMEQANSKKTRVKAILPAKYENLNLLKEITNGELKHSALKLHNASCSIINNMIVFHEYEDDSKVIAIKNKTLATYMKDVFDLLWNK